MKPEGILLSEISQRDRKIPYNFIHMWNLKKKKNKREAKQKQNHRYRDTVEGGQWGGGEGKQKERRGQWHDDV